jgi:3-hydroxybutyryl-CoA dehydrogenase
VKTIGIVGTGKMGTDISFTAATAGFEVLMLDIDKKKLEAAGQIISNRLARYADEGRIEKKIKPDIEKRITACDSLVDLSGADIVIECVTENLDIKKGVFTELDRICVPETILGSNTSSISITEIAAATDRPESVIGVHFLVPAHVMRLVEIIPGLATTRETVEVIKMLVKKMGKIHVESRDFPGFLLNRMLMPMINEAIYLLYEGAGTPESIDRVMTYGLNQPMGPLSLADMIGLDVVLAISEEMYNSYSDIRYRPCPLLKKYVAAGYLGRKSGRGFYIYND